MKDILGWFRGNLVFHEVEKQHPGYIPKWWYYAEDELALSILDPLIPVEKIPKKRGRKPREILAPLRTENDNSGEFF